MRHSPLFLLLSAVAFGPLTAAQTLTRAEKAEAVNAIANLVVESYVYEADAKRIAAFLGQQLASGAYDGISDPGAFAKALTSDLRRSGDDEHLEVVLREPEPLSPQPPANDWEADLRRRNFDFARVERLAGNVGYLDLRSFPPPEVAGDTAAAAMQFLANSEAIIIDLRRNSGGTGDMAQFLATYFFEQRTTLTRTFRRADNRFTEDRTLAYVPGRRMPTIDLYLLTSRGTFSAAEAFAFGLQQAGRAMVVGERTRGGANAGRYRRATERFNVFIPNAHAVAATTEKSWDRIGVQPDIPVSASEALEVAHQRSVQKLAEKTADATRRRELTWLVESLRATPSAADASLAGTYGPISIRRDGSRFLYSRDRGPERPLLPVSGTILAVDGAEWLRLRFAGAMLVVEHSDGSEERFDKER
jgi:retinol-binding protein 3